MVKEMSNLDNSRKETRFFVIVVQRMRKFGKSFLENAGFAQVVLEERKSTSFLI